MKKRHFKKDIILKIVQLLSFISITFLLVLGSEFIIKGDINNIFTWITCSTKQLILNMILIGMLIILFKNIFGMLGYSVLFLGVTYYIMSIVSYYKFFFRKEYLYPGDFKLLGEATNIIKEFDINIEKHIIWAILLLIWIIIMSFKLQKERKTSKIEIGMSGLSLLLVINLYMNNEFLNKINVQLSGWDNTIEESYSENGYALSFINNINKLIVKKPAEYSKEKIDSILNMNNELKEEFKKPNIIMVMSEAFYDITEIHELEFKSDPLKNFHKYQKEFIGGNMITSVAIGGTAQTEYEVITGNSVNFTGEENIGYMNYVNEFTPSIPKIMKSEGYNTLAIHPYDRKFYSREKAYELLGIDKYISIEMFRNPETKREYITDKEVVKKLINEYEQSDDKPLLAHIVTMQNHAPYNNENIIDNTHIKDNKDLSKENKQIINTYIDGLKDSDEALKYLVDYFSKIEEPTIILYYGDHIPLLGKNQSAFLELNYFNENDDENTIKYYHTPFMMWNNYGLESKQYEYLDSSYLGAIMLENINYNNDEYFNLLNKYKEQIKGFTKNVYIDKDNNIKNISMLNKKEIDLIKNWWLIVYDRIFGNKYSIVGG